MKNALKLSIAAAFLIAASFSAPAYAKKGGKGGGGVKKASPSKSNAKAGAARASRASKSKSSNARSANSSSKQSIQTKTKASGHNGAKKLTAATRRVIHNRVYDRLKLNAAQKAKLNNLIENMQKRRAAFLQKNGAKLKQLKEALKAALRAGDKAKVAAIRDQIKQLGKVEKDTMRQQLSGILSPNQMNTLETMKSEYGSDQGEDVAIENQLVSIFDF